MAQPLKIGVTPVLTDYDAAFGPVTGPSLGTLGVLTLGRVNFDLL